MHFLHSQRGQLQPVRAVQHLLVRLRVRRHPLLLHHADRVDDMHSGHNDHDNNDGPYTRLPGTNVFMTNFCIFSKNILSGWRFYLQFLSAENQF
jgi:hypothetical protein